MPDPYWSDMAARSRDEYQRGTVAMGPIRFGVVRVRCGRCGRTFMRGWDDQRSGRKPQCPPCRRKP